MFIYAFESGPLATIAYLVGDDSGRAIIIDAPKDCAERIQLAAANKNIVPEKLLLTHSHWDHTADADALKKMFNIPVYVHKQDEYRLVEPKTELIQPPFTLLPMHADLYLEENDEIMVGGLHFQVLFTPGHTEGSVCFYESTEGVLFTGDTLFAGSVGRTDLSGGSWEVLMHSIQTKLLPLPDNIAAYPGHGPQTTIGIERLYNPFLNGETADNDE